MTFAFTCSLVKVTWCFEVLPHGGAGSTDPAEAGVGPSRPVRGAGFQVLPTVPTSHIRTNVMRLTAHWPNDLEMPKVAHNAQFTMTNVQSVLLIGQSVVEFIEVFRSMTNCRICRRIVMEHWPNANEKRCTGPIWPKLALWDPLPCLEYSVSV